MLIGALLVSAASLGAGFLLGGFSVRASMDHLVREAQADRDLANRRTARVSEDAQAEIAHWHDFAASPVSSLLAVAQGGRS